MCKHILENRKKVEQSLWKEPKEGTSNIWNDNWTNLGPLFPHPTKVQTYHNIINTVIIVAKIKYYYKVRNNIGKSANKHTLFYK